MSSNAKIHYIFEDIKIDFISDDFMFRDNRYPFLSAEISPPIDGLSKFHFVYIELLDSTLRIFNPSLRQIDLPESTVYTIKVIKPLPFPIERNWNSVLTQMNNYCHGHIFYFDPVFDRNLEQVQYMKSFGTRWKDLSSLIERSLTESNLGTFGVSVGVLSNDSSFPELTPIHEAFSDIKVGNLSLIVIVSSFKEFTITIGENNFSSVNVPRIPKMFLNLISNFGDQSLNYSPVRGRIIKSLFNGGIPSNLFDREDLLRHPTFDDRFIRSDDFQSINLNLLVKDRKFNLTSFKTKFHCQLRCLKRFHSRTNEAGLRTLFWDAIFSILACDLKSPDLQVEWQVSQLFSELGSRRIDMVSIVTIDGEEYPILQIEVGTMGFDLRNPHKDQSKLLATMSQTEALESFVEIYEEFVKFSGINFNDGVVREAQIMILAQKFNKKSDEESAAATIETLSTDSEPEESKEPIITEKRLKLMIEQKDISFTELIPGPQ